MWSTVRSVKQHITREQQLPPTVLRRLHSNPVNHDKKNEGGTMPTMKVVCPRCKRIWIAHEGEIEVDCNCHLYCTQGNKPSDCSVTTVSFSGQLGWPTGLHVNADDYSDDVLHILRYCSTHAEYLHKVPIAVECDWEKWHSRRAPKKLRMSHGKY